MIMTAELNSHQRVSYYTGVKLIRHHQSASTANPNNNNNSTSNNSNNNTSVNSSTTGAFYHHHNHYPPHPHHHHHHHPQQHPPSLPPHHPGHYHLSCPTGPPHIQHPGGVLHLNNHHGPHHHHQHHNGHHHFGGGGGSSQTTRLYTGSPLIRSTGYHSPSSVSGGSGGGPGSSKRSFKNHQHRNNHHHHNNHHSNNSRSGGGGNPSHYLNQSNIGGSCSSGTSSSSSSNEHLNNLQSPAGSPVTQAKLDISPLKLPSSSTLNVESSSSNNSSPGPQGSPSPSISSNLSSSSSSSSPNSTDGNKDLDHFYFLDEHWKPSTEVNGVNGNGTAVGISSADLLDVSSSSNNNSNARWTSSNNRSPSTGSTALTMMVDQFFANGHNNNFGLVDGNNNFMGINGDGVGGGLMRDLNNNIIGGQQPEFNESHPQNDRFPSNSNSLSGFNSGNNNVNGRHEGTSGLFNFGPEGKFNGIHNSSSSSAATTVVNVETQIGTFNGQRDLEIRLCFIKGDNKAHQESMFGENHQSSQTGSPQHAAALKLNNMRGVSEEDSKTVTAIGEPFISSSSRLSEQAELQSKTFLTSSDSEMDNKGEPAKDIGVLISRNSEIAQQS